MLPIGDNYHGPDDAHRAVKLARRGVIPIHYNTFDLIRQDADAWAERVQKPIQAHVLQPGNALSWRIKPVSKTRYWKLIRRLAT